MCVKTRQRTYLHWPVTSLCAACCCDVIPRSIRYSCSMVDTSDWWWGTQAEQVWNTVHRPSLSCQVNGNQLSLSQYHYTLRLIYNSNNVLVNYWAQAQLPFLYLIYRMHKNAAYVSNEHTCYNFTNCSWMSVSMKVGTHFCQQRGSFGTMQTYWL